MIAVACYAGGEYPVVVSQLYGISSHSGGIFPLLCVICQWQTPHTCLPCCACVWRLGGCGQITVTLTHSALIWHIAYLARQLSGPIGSCIRLGLQSRASTVVVCRGGIPVGLSCPMTGCHSECQVPLEVSVVSVEILHLQHKAGRVPEHGTR